MKKNKFRIWKFSNVQQKWKMDYNPVLYDYESFSEEAMVRLNVALRRNGDATLEKNTVVRNADGKRIEKDKLKVFFMQYIGLLDKNGKEIYEGDIVKITDNKGRIFKSYIVFKNAEFKAKGVLCPLATSGLEILGNIYEIKLLKNYEKNRSQNKKK